MTHEQRDPEYQRVLAANAAFYAAFRNGDIAAMDRIWSQRDSIRVTHPNMPEIVGRDTVMQSWSFLLVDGAPPDIHPADPHVIVSRNIAMVICDEDLGFIRMIATNIFKCESGSWRMVDHHATCIPVADQPQGQQSKISRSRRS